MKEKTLERKKLEAERARIRYHTNAEYRLRKHQKMKEWAEKNKDKINAYSYAREKTPQRLKQKAEAQARYRKKMKALGLYKNVRGDRTKQTVRWVARPGNRFKKRAHMAVYYEIKMGRLEKQPCEVCKKVPAHAHHDDYTKPLDVRWLCSLHHYKHHQNVV